MSYSTKTHRILKTMYKGGGINRNLFTRSELKRLFQDHYIINSTNYYDENVYLTEDGRAYVEELPPQTLCCKLLDWIKENVLELIAIIISIIALLKP